MSERCSGWMAVVVVAGCASTPRSDVREPLAPGADPAPGARTSPSAERNRDIARLNARAGNRGDEELWPSKRCGAVFELFSKHIEVGMSAPEVAEVLTDLSWISYEGRFEPTREVPIAINPDHATIVAHCLGQTEDPLGGGPDAEYFVYLRVSDPRVQTLSGFLIAGRRASLLEYVVEYPDMTFVGPNLPGSKPPE